MKRWAVLLAAICAIASAASAQTFMLKHDETGKLLGPFEFKEGARVKIGDTSFTIVKAESQMAAVKQVLETTVVPQLDFREARVRDVLDFLRTASVDFSPLQDPKQKGVNIVVKVPPESKLLDVPITFKANNMNMYEILKAVTGVAQLDFEVQIGWILITPKAPKPPAK